jgi:hypothetical protein
LGNKRRRKRKRRNKYTVVLIICNGILSGENIASKGVKLVLRE